MTKRHNSHASYVTMEKAIVPSQVFLREQGCHGNKETERVQGVTGEKVISQLKRFSKRFFVIFSWSFLPVQRWRLP